MILFDFYSTRYKVLLCLHCINTQQLTTSPLYITHDISSSYHQKKGVYQGSANRCEGDRNSDLIFLIQEYQEIHYCNQSVLAIVPDLNIFVFSITIVDLILRSDLVRFSLLHASYLYNLIGIRFYIFFL